MLTKYARTHYYQVFRFRFFTSKKREKMEQNKNNQHYKVSDNCELLNIVKHPKTSEYYIGCGGVIISNKAFKTIKNAEEYIASKPYELIVNLTLTILNEYEKNIQEANKSSEENNKSDK